jgi:MICOS complex subunit MIC12
MEGAVSRLLGGGLQKSREGIEEVEKKDGPKVPEAVDRSKAAARKGADQAAVGFDKAAAATIADAERVGAEVRDGASKVAASTKAKTEKVVGSSKEQLGHAGDTSGELWNAAKAKSERVAANAKSGAQDAAESVRSGGTVDAVRGAVRDTFTKGVEKGKEAIGKASTAIGLAEEKVESRTQSATLSHSSAVEKALHERYEKPGPVNKTVEEVLEERYKPIEKRDNTVLRGV